LFLALLKGSENDEKHKEPCRGKGH
jgi:hypothetical protein